MRVIDYHMHTHFSGDSEANPREHVLKAIEMNLDEICFTDHRDFDYPIDSFELDVENYQEEIENLIQQYPFDFVIGSIHVIHHTEFYYGEFFKGKTKEQAHREFFEETLKCVKAFDCFNVLGHLDYIVRYGPYEDKTVDHQKYQDIIDEIFKTLIQKGKGIEVNTSGYRDLKTCGFPNFEQVQRYYDLGGRIITIGTDSHTSDRVGENCLNVAKKYQEIGFDDVSTFTQRKRD